ncbi:unnamed protein product, partial [Allacma fusca]
RSPPQVAQGKPQNPAPDFTCPEEFGYFPHPDDCTQYYVCVFGGALLESCTGGLMYSHDLQTCDWPRNVNCGLQGNQSFVYDRTVPARDSLRERDYTLNPAPRPTENVRQQSVSSKLKDNSDLIGNVVSTSPKYSDIRFQDDNQADGSRLGRSYEQTVPNYKEEIYAVGRSVNGGSGKTTPALSQQEIIIDPEYLSQRYAANVQPQQVNSTSNLYYDDSAYYIYDEEKEEPQYDDVDYKTAQQQQPQKPQVIQQQQQPVIIQTTTRRPVPVAPTTAKPTRSSSRGSARHKSSGNRPTLKPSSTIVKDVQDNVRDVYVDPPTRPLPVYETPVPNTPATKCRKDECALPDCFCGGKAIPGDLPVNTVPQMVLLTFDDSVNDLNKDLYRDLFEKGRKNPNGCPISATFYVSHEWTDYSQVQNLAADGHEIASHSISHSFGEQFSQKKWDKEIGGQREILAAYGGVKLSEVRGMRAPFLSVGGNNMFKMLYDSNFTYDSSMPVYENRPPSWPYTLDHKLFHDCMIPPCPTKSYPGIWEVPMVMWQDLKGGRCSMGDACSNPPTAEGVYNMLAKNFERHYTTNRAPFGLYYHAAWFTQPHHKEGFEAFLDTLVNMDDVFLVTNYQALQWVRNPTPLSHILNFEPFSCHNNKDRPRRCNHPKVCNLWHKSGVRYMKTCQQCPSQYPWVGNTVLNSCSLFNKQ